VVLGEGGFCSLSLMISTSTTMIKEIRRKDKINKKLK
jgi:hypothetical protein